MEEWELSYSLVLDVAHNTLGTITQFAPSEKVELLSYCPDFLFPTFLWSLLLLFVIFCKDIVGTGRTMKVLLNNIEKYKPKMIKVAR